MYQPIQFSEIKYYWFLLMTQQGQLVISKYASGASDKNYLRGESFNTWLVPVLWVVFESCLSWILPSYCRSLYNTRQIVILCNNFFVGNLLPLFFTAMTSCSSKSLRVCAWDGVSMWNDLLMPCCDMHVIVTWKLPLNRVQGEVFWYLVNNIPPLKENNRLGSRSPIWEYGAEWSLKEEDNSSDE